MAAFLLLGGFTLLGVNGASGQERNREPQANWALAEKFSSDNISRFIYTASVQPHWILETDSLWYQWSDAQGTRFHLVIPSGPVKRPLFDHQRMAERLSQELGKPLEANVLPMEDIEFSEDGRSFKFVAEEVLFEYNLRDQTLTNLGEEEEEEEEREWRRFSPDSTAYVYAEAHNLHLVKIVDGEEQEAIQLTTDGEENYSFGSREVDQEDPDDGADLTRRRVRSGATWSEDSQAFYVSRADWRGIDADLWVVNSLEKARPSLKTYRKVMPGEEVGYRELHVYRRGETTLTELPEVHRWKDQSHVDIHWGPSSDRLRLIRRDRLWQNLDLIEVDLDSGEVTVLISESLKWSTIEGGSGFGTMYQARYVESGGEILWWSERTGWGHFYLYDNRGNLKHPVTSGAWRAESLLAVDSVARVAWIRGMGREEGENPYHQHLYRVNLDGSNLTLLDPGDYFHNSTLSPSRRFIVSSHSRPDTPWRSVLRNARGHVIIELEEMDVSQLEGMGWSPPEMFVVKSAGGVTNLHGNIWKPFDFDPEKRYPIIASVYPGPQSEGLSSSFSPDPGLQALAQLGFIVIQVGNRGGSPKRSAAYRAHSYQDLRDYGLADKRAAIQELAARHPYIDLDRVGIFGHSGGGFMTAAAMLVPPYNEFFKVGVASNGNHDNNVYSDYWAEQNHGLRYTCVAREEAAAEVDQAEDAPSDHKKLRRAREIPGDGYCEPNERVEWKIEVPTNAEVAENLKGHLMLAFSDMDTNVHPANTIRLVDALIRGEKRFDLLLFPGQAHGFGRMNGYFQRMRNEYFAEHLLGDYYRDRADMR